MILDLDIGNSGISWLRTTEVGIEKSAIEAGIEKSAIEKSGRANTFAELKSQVNSEVSSAVSKDAQLRRIRISCVLRDEKIKSQLLQQIQEGIIENAPGSVQIDIAKVVKQHSGVTIAYAKPHNLGVDRWLALLAAHHYVGQGIEQDVGQGIEQDIGQGIEQDVEQGTASSSWLIIDAGTAVTVDLMDKGKHLGGLIIPGLQLLRDSFYDKTQIISSHASQPVEVKMDIEMNEHSNKKEFSEEFPKEHWGSDTDSCLNIGTHLALEGFVQQNLTNYFATYPDGKVMFTGGYGNKLYKQASKIYRPSEQIYYDSHLVCRGLAHALP